MPAEPLLTAALDHVRRTLSTIDAQLAALDASQAGETKSSAGDKFETSREMMQQERDRLEVQRAVAREQYLQITLAERAARARSGAGEGVMDVGLGSEVTLGNGERYLVAAAVGRLRLDEGGKAHAISVESPLARALWGRSVGEVVVFRGRSLTIASVN